ncbi:hypothetical protein [Phenylobacterium sp.]|jgi:hypothetical protein|uniref:hypothetical protein n=1 Tax=Phenylobacterium sp. TaxID=1871053 RepID=UPI002E334D4C|nr:hypothetical protein [Phenylobacterium sp.]HEX4710443.1 hypothetical protein [Phenylobacterium sp.]
MKAHILDTDALRGVGPLALAAYATFEGWQKGEAYGDYGNVYVKVLASGLTREVLLPFTTDLADFSAAVSSAIRTFAEVEGRDELRVYRDLTRADRDIIRVRAPEADDDGSISVEPGVELIHQARDLLAAAACSAVDPRPAYHLNKVTRAGDYMRRVRLGQTEQGSFIVTLLAPIPPQLAVAQTALWPELEDEPYERQVTRYLADGLVSAHAVINAINQGRGVEAFNEAVVRGVSANLCEAVAGIIDQSDGADISVTWARTRPTPEQRARITFTRSDADVLREAGRYFRLQEPRRDETVLGYVISLARTEHEAEGSVTLKTLVDGRERSLRVELSEPDYEVALRAHRDRAPVMLRGDIEMKGQRWRITQPRDLRIIGAGYADADPTP